ncbi:iron-containing alcohol dehydrogenase [uncultured Megamonas sp.]|uniref:iron-containing alcohol dehydrogenase n=2 Tax=uncultured Megamonas sp. TaxID=286140 RepID=UPI00266F4871|nr:iron-containing alcohol dehydrogenase [uncultured Megamonas sp.]
MEKFKFYCPTEIIFGKDSELSTSSLIKKYNGHNVLIVYGGGSVKRSGLLDKICQQLSDDNLSYITLGGVQPNPIVSFVNNTIKTANQANIDFVLAIGGGSVIDTAKAIAHGLKYPQHDIWDIWTKKITLTSTTPIGSIVTLAAAGSETSDSAVLTNEQTGQKRGLSTPFNRPCFAIMNPQLTYSAPNYQKACGIADILMHTLERYFAKEQCNYLTDYIAEGLLKDVITQAPIMLNDSTNYTAHSEIMYAGSLSHNDITGLGRTKDFSVHKFGHELSAKYNATHGASLTAIWSSWARYIYQKDINRFCHLGKVIFGLNETNQNDETMALETIKHFEEFFTSLNLPINISQLIGRVLTDEELTYLTSMCTDNDTKTIGNFSPLNYQDVYAIFKLANH